MYVRYLPSVLLVKFFFAFLCTKINTNTKSMDPRGRPQLKEGSVLLN